MTALVLGYDKNAGYSGSNRDHFGALKDSQIMIEKKTDISSQIVIIKDGEEQYNNSLKNTRIFAKQKITTGKLFWLN